MDNEEATVEKILVEAIGLLQGLAAQAAGTEFAGLCLVTAMLTGEVYDHIYSEQEEN